MRKIMGMLILVGLVLAGCAVSSNEISDNAIVTYRTYGGFTPIDQAEYILTINNSYSALTVLDHQGQVTARFEKKITKEVYTQLIGLLNNNNFLEMNALYERQPGQPGVADLGNLEINVKDSGINKTVRVQPRLEDYMPKGLVNIKRYIEQIETYTIGNNTIGGNTGGNSNSKEETLTFQPMQCEKTPWDKWYEEGNAQFIKKPTEKEIALAYFGSMNIEASDFKKVDSGLMACEACSVCPTSYYYTVNSKDTEKLKEIGFK